LSVRSIPTGPSSPIEPPAPAALAERASTATRFEQELGRETELVSRRDDEPDDATLPDEGDATDAAATHDAHAPVDAEGTDAARADERAAVAEDDGDDGDDGDDSAASDGDDELAALEQLLLVVAGAPPTPKPICAANGGDSTIVAEGAIAAIATIATKSGAGAGNAAGGATATTATTAAPANASGEEAAIEGAGEESATTADFASVLKEGGAARAESDADALDASAPADATTTTTTAPTLDPALAERLARELADARPNVATHALAAPTAPPELTAPAGLARATATLAQLPALLDDGFVRLQRKDGRWEAEIRLDPPELGVVNVKLELDGGHLRVVARCDDRGVEQQLGQLFREWDEDLRKQGGEASFDLGRRAKGEERDATQARGERSLPSARAARSGRGVGPGAGLRIDLLA